MHSPQRSYRTFEDACMAQDARIAAKQIAALPTVEDTDDLYNRYVSNGYADSDGYYRPISREAFGKLNRRTQENFAR